MAGIFGQAFLRSATHDKAVRGFEVCGLWPFNDQVCTAYDFAAACVTEKIQPYASHTSTSQASTDYSLCPASRPQPTRHQLTSLQLILYYLYPFPNLSHSHTIKYLPIQVK